MAKFLWACVALLIASLSTPQICSLSAKPIAGFSATVTSGCSPLKIDFKNTSKGGVSYLWKLGNSNTSNLLAPSAVYNMPGKYSITLIATDAAGLSDTLELKDYITVFRNPLARFVADRKTLCLGDSLHLGDMTIQGDAPIKSWTWDMGNGDVLYGPKPVFAYKSKGTYDISYAVTDQNGCNSTYKEVSSVSVFSLPGVGFSSINPVKCNAPALIEFTSTANGAGPFSYGWDFGDGGTASVANPNHTFDSAGKYKISLTVADSRGCRNTSTIDNFVYVGQPMANYVIASNTICQGSRIEVQNTSYPPAGICTWDFGDGDTLYYGNNPLKYYAKVGSYAIKLTYIWDKCTSTVVKTIPIVVKPAPSVKIVPGDTAVCRNASGILNMSLQGSDFNMAQWSKDTNPHRSNDTGSIYQFHTDTNGYHTIRVKVKSTLGCGVGTDSVRVLVRGPFSSINLTQNKGCIPYNTTGTFNGVSDAPIKDYHWFSTQIGLNSSKPKINITNSHFGVTLIYLTVTDINGCSHTSLQVMGAGVKIAPVFQASKTEICSNEPFTIYNKSKTKSGDSVAVFWSWFGKDTIPFPGKDSAELKFRAAPNEKLRLTFTNNSYGCATQAELFIKVNGPLLDGFVHPFCDKDSINGMNLSKDYTNTWWRYENGAGNTVIQPELPLNLSLFSTKNLWLFATNSKTGCKDSMPVNFQTDPQVAAFNWTVDCKTHVLNTTNLYKGLLDTQFTWTLTNHTTGTVSNFKARHISKLVLGYGFYTLKLAVRNKQFQCTKSQSVDFHIFDVDNVKPEVENTSKVCNPVSLVLHDQFFGNWINPLWSIDKKTSIPDTAERIPYTYSGGGSSIWIHHYKTDDIGCRYHDSFLINIGGPSPDISMDGQDNSNCLNPVIRVSAVNYKPTPKTNYTYIWDFGYRKGNSISDTMLIHGSKTVKIQLTILDDRGCSSSIAKSFDVVAGKPKAKFKVLADTLVSCPPLQVAFLDSSIGGFGPVTFRRFDFGDNTYSSKTNPSKMYVMPGEYTVSLIVGNSANCFDTLSIPKLAVVKGPVGKFSISDLKGCTPFAVELKAQTSAGVSKIAFDMGDGVVLDASNRKHTYVRPGSYVPRLMMTDSNGCRFSPEPTDTIVVHPSPRAVLEGGPVCKYKEYTITQKSVSDDSLKEIVWTSNGKVLGNSNSISASFNYDKFNYIRLRVSTINECKDSTVAVFNAYDIHASVSIPRDEYCLGSLVKIKDGSMSDTNIVSRSLWIGNQAMSISNPFVYVANKKGIVPMKFVVSNIIGCKDSISTNAFLKVGDTAAPPAQPIFRTTVTSDFSTETRFAQSKEVDFKDQHLYVFLNNKWTLAYSTANRADTNLVVNGLNTLGKSYCHIIRQRNFCGVMTDSSKVVPHCSIETKAFGDTNSGLVTWSPYVGWKQVKQYHIWRKPKGSETFTRVGTVAGNTLQYRDTTVFCHVIYDYRVEGLENGGYQSNSYSDTANCKPIHLRTVPAPEVWRTTVERNAFTRTEWLMPKTPKYPVSFYSIYRQEGSDWKLMAPKVDSLSNFIEDMATEVQNSTYSYRVTATDVCQTVSPASNVGRSILLSVSQGEGENQDAKLSWTPYIYWNEGVKEYQIERSVSGSSFSKIGSVAGNSLSFSDQDIPKTCVKDIVYRVVAIRNQPVNPDSTHYAESVSNQRNYIPEIKFFIPNAFTPNQNNLNEGFRPDGMYYSAYEMKIYNRWGQKVYDGSDCQNFWDGKYEQQDAPEGVYAYYIIATDMGGKTYQFNGSITLLR